MDKSNKTEQINRVSTSIGYPPKTFNGARNLGGLAYKLGIHRNTLSSWCGLAGFGGGPRTTTTPLLSTAPLEAARADTLARYAVFITVPF